MTISFLICPSAGPVCIVDNCYDSNMHKLGLQVRTFLRSAAISYEKTQQICEIFASSVTHSLNILMVFAAIPRYMTQQEGVQEHASIVTKIYQVSALQYISLLGFIQTAHFILCGGMDNVHVFFRYCHVI